MLLQVLQVLVVSQLHLVAEVYHLAQLLQIVLLLVHSLLDATVQVDGQHTLRTSRNTTGTQRVGEAVVRDLVPQAAARGKRVGVVAHVGEERVTLGIHLSREVAPLLVLGLAILVGQQRHGLHGESQQRLGSLAVEPLHETLLQPGESLPVGLRTIGEVELAEDALEVILVIVSHIPEHSLVVAGTRGLVERIHNLLEVVRDDLVDGTLLQTHVSLLVGTLVVVLAILLADEIVHVHQELRRSAGTGEHR